MRVWVWRCGHSYGHEKCLWEWGYGYRYEDTYILEYVDVNVTPDKRQVMIQQEKALLTLVRVRVQLLIVINNNYYII